MSIYPLNQFLKSSQTVQPQTPALALPKDVWQIILSYINFNKLPLQGVCSYAFVCKFFLQQCLLSCSSFYASFTLNELPSLIPENPVEKPVNFFPFALSLKQLSMGDDGKRYFSDTNHIIVEEFGQEGFQLIDLNQEQTFPFTLLHDFDRQIVSNHPINDGFILITKKGVSAWCPKENQSYYCYSHITPAIYENGLKNDEPLDLIFSAYKNGILYLGFREFDETKTLIHGFKTFKVDFENNGSILATNAFRTKANLFLTSSGNRIYACSLKEEEDLYEEMLDETNLTRNNYFFKLVPYSFKKAFSLAHINIKNMRHVHSSNWLLIYEDATFPMRVKIRVVNVKTNKIWNEEMTIEGSSQYFTAFPYISNLFLFITYIGKQLSDSRFRIIDLPHKIDLTEKIEPHLLKFVQQGAVVVDVQLDKKEMTKVHVLLKREVKKENQTGTEFFEIVIPFVKDPAPPSKKLKKGS